MEQLKGYRTVPLRCKFEHCPNEAHTRQSGWCRAHQMQLWRAEGDETKLKPLRVRNPRISDDGSEYRCRKCGEWKPAGDFSPDNARGRVRECRPCRARLMREWNRNNPEAVRRIILRRKGLTIEGYEEMLATQGGGCAICGSVNENGRLLAVDHEHKTGRVRGLLCGTCNAALGLLRDDVALLRRAIDYLL